MFYDGCDFMRPDERNDWIGFGNTCNGEGFYHDHVLGVYANRTHYSYHPRWSPTSVHRQRGWHEFRFESYPNRAVLYYIDSVLVHNAPYCGPVQGVSIRGNKSSVAWWSPPAFTS